MNKQRNKANRAATAVRSNGHSRRPAPKHVLQCNADGGAKQVIGYLQDMAGQLAELAEQAGGLDTLVHLLRLAESEAEQLHTGIPLSELSFIG